MTSTTVSSKTNKEGPARTDINIDHLTKLARIALSDEEKLRFAGELCLILDYFEQLKSVDVSGVEPSAHPFPVFNVLRDDAAGPMLGADALRLIAPVFRDDCVVVPRIVDDEG
ncbi:MAG: Asp-tRNA(Asn)/Glu-tRNA(Gln) amidotransferase subunit GatC [Puniceicoccales bacterium]|jgi:aspartyl-tRNA(Asn)/glutamyl-tRNA(Gln) amidotransferase subunit C|nr:Asp-tRNA(Asn)/Glu-tRNA(Gln) amidotransferase subunit GatC [Puniceicoccales bacterium]